MSEYKRLTTDEYIANFMTDEYELREGCTYFNNYNSIYLKRVSLRGKIKETLKLLAAYEDSGLSPEEVAELAKIVRCKDCKHFFDRIYGRGLCDKQHLYDMNDDDFCSRGELKGEK